MTGLIFLCHHRHCSFFSLPAPQVVYFTEMYKVFSELTDQIDQAGLTDEQRERETEAKLSELRALSIVADDWGRKAAKTGSAPFMPLSEWIALFSGSFLCADQTDSGGLNLIISLFPCSLINPPFLLHYTPMFHSQTLCNSKQLKCHINEAISQVHHYKPICCFFLVKESNSSRQN